MKRVLVLSLAVITFAALSMSCSKEVDVPKNVDIDNPQNEDPTPARQQITISATLPQNMTKVSFEPSYEGGKPTELVLKWKETDKLRVANAAAPETYEDFTLSSGAGTNKASFTGVPPVGATSYNVSVVHENVTYSSQSQPKDGDTSGLQYIASKDGITDLSTIAFDNINSVLAITTKMPTGVAASIKSVEITASEAIFNGGKTLTITLDTPEDEGVDEILHLFATLPQGDQVVAENTKLYLVFTSASGVKYTTFRTISSETTFTSGKLNYININCTGDGDKALQIWDGNGTSGNPYLIDTPYKLAVVNLLATGGQTTCFKMTADVNMNSVLHLPINTNSGYTQVVNFDGNNKTVQQLNTSLFYVFKGSIQNLKLKYSGVGSKRGIFAEYCQGTGHTITNVDILNSNMSSSSANCGALIGNINNGSDGITTVTITGCDVKSSTIQGGAQTGGLLGNVAAKTEVSNCTVASVDGGSLVRASGNNSGGLIGQTQAEVTITNCTVSGIRVEGTGVVGGVVGFANSLVTISGSKFTSSDYTDTGEVSATSKYCGGFLGSTSNVASAITNCQVEDATVSTTCKDDARCGGFVGQLQTSCQVQGCTVGTPSKKVTVSTPNPTTDKVLNTGGFVGVNYGTITKNGDVRTKAYVKITSSNTQGQPLNLGGFVGFGRGTIEYCDAIVDMTSLKGQYIGGFAGYVTNAGTVIDNCSVDGLVTGNNYTGGFAGYVDSGAPVISNCTASGNVTAQSGCGGFVGQTMSGVYTNCSTSAICSFSGSNNGGFAGQIHGGTLTGCSASGSVTATGGSTYGGFVGLITNNGTTLEKCFSSSDVTGNGSYNGGFAGTIDKGTVLIKRCYATGSITSDKTYAAGFIANISHATNVINVTIQNCYSTGNIINSNQVRGGFIAQSGTVTSVTISNCYATGAVVGSFRLGGLIGNIASDKTTVDHCAAWNSEVTASSHGSGNWSSGAVVGTAFPTCTLTDNYRKPDISLLAFWGNVTGYTWKLEDDYQHPNVSSSSPLIICEKSASTFTLRPTSATALASGQDNYPIFPYHGKVEAGKTLSQLASTTLGWSSEIWDFSGPLPLLK